MGTFGSRTFGFQLVLNKKSIDELIALQGIRQTSLWAVSIAVIAFTLGFIAFSWLCLFNQPFCAILSLKSTPICFEIGVVYWTSLLIVCLCLFTQTTPVSAFPPSVTRISSAWDCCNQSDKYSVRSPECWNWLPCWHLACKSWQSRYHHQRIGKLDYSLNGCLYQQWKLYWTICKNQVASNTANTYLALIGWSGGASPNILCKLTTLSGHFLWYAHPKTNLSSK